MTAAASATIAAAFNCITTTISRTTTTTTTTNNNNVAGDDNSEMQRWQLHPSLLTHPEHYPRSLENVERIRVPMLDKNYCDNSIKYL